MSSYLLRLAQRLNSRYAPKDGFPPVFLMGDDEKLPDLHPFLTDLPKGSAIIIRSRSRHRRLDQIRGLKTPCRRFGLKILVADDWALAVSHHLDGVHLPGNRLKKFRFNHGRLRRPYPDFLITASAHSATAIQTARNCGVCGVFLSPIFPTTSHPNGKSLGRWRLHDHITKTTPTLGAIGLGGLNTKTAPALQNTRLCAFAGISGLLPHS